MTTTLILLTTRAPHALTDELTLAGHRVFEALAISEVFALVEEYPGAQIVITADVHDERAKAIQKHYPTIQLKADETLKAVLLIDKSIEERKRILADVAKDFVVPMQPVFEFGEEVDLDTAIDAVKRTKIKGLVAKRLGSLKQKRK
jgi:hypothetical protein